MQGSGFHAGCDLAVRDMVLVHLAPLRDLLIPWFSFELVIPVQTAIVLTSGGVVLG